MIYFPATKEAWHKFITVMIFICPVPIIIGGIFAYNTYSFLQTAVTAEAEIVDLIETQGKDGSMYKPVFKFTDQDGIKRTVRSSMSSSPPIGKKGDIMKIYYDPQNPKKIKPDHFMFLWGFAIGFPAMGGFWLIILSIAWYFTRTKPEPDPDQEENAHVF